MKELDTHMLYSNDEIYLKMGDEIYKFSEL